MGERNCLGHRGREAGSVRCDYGTHRSTRMSVLDGRSDVPDEQPFPFHEMRIDRGHRHNRKVSSGGRRKSYAPTKQIMVRSMRSCECEGQPPAHRQRSSNRCSIHFVVGGRMNIAQPRVRSTYLVVLVKCCFEVDRARTFGEGTISSIGEG